MDTKLNDTENNSINKYRCYDNFTPEKKEKKLHPVKSWIAFFLAVNMIFIACFAGIIFTAEISTASLETIEDYVRSSIPSVKLYDSARYRETMIDYIRALNYYINLDGTEADTDYEAYLLQYLQNEINAKNVIVYAKNNSTGKEFPGTSDFQADELYKNGLLYTEGHFYSASSSDYYDGISLIPLSNNSADIENTRIPEIGLNAEIISKNDDIIDLFKRDVRNLSNTEAFSNKDCTICVLVINSDMISINTSLYYAYQNLRIVNLAFILCVVYIIVMILLSVYASIKRKDRIYANYHMARFFDNFWIELKLALFLCFIGSAIAISVEMFWTDDIIALMTACVIGVWGLYLLGVDIRHNTFRRCFGNNIFMSTKRQVEKVAGKLSYGYHLSLHERPFVKVMRKKFINYIIFMAIILFFFTWSLFAFIVGNFGAFLIVVICVGLGVYLTYRYLKNTCETLYEFTKISDKIISIRNGIDSDPLIFPPESLLKNTAFALNDVQSGIKNAVEEQMKSERMKIELVTNVSHDIKTPLTSLISYTELLNQCDNLTDEAKDYIKILKEKLRRLTELIGNLFDLSKATSSEMEVVRDEIDLRKLINQVDAQFSDSIEDTGLKFIYRMPDEPVMLYSDGAKLHRVLENLYINVLKYSLEGSRVFVSLIPTSEYVKFSIANISREEIDYTPEEIMSRFVRGDKTRTTEGSGLGLAIARSFTELCGGDFSLEFDGDVFKVNIKFPSYTPVMNQLILEK